MGMTIPEEYGGGGTDTLSYAIAVEELTRIDSSVAITVAAHHSLGTLPIYYFGTEEQKRQWLPDLASGRKLAAFGLTEPNAGSDAGATRTTARLEGGEWVVDGSKMFITNAGTDITACVTITAVTGEGEISNIVVPNGTPGYVISAPMDKLGWRASDTRELSFQGARVPEGNLLGPRGEGFQQFLEILDGGRISVAAMGVGLAQGAYDLAYAYAKEREQFGRPIAKFQAVQPKLVDMATEIEAARAARVEGRVGEGPGPRVRARRRRWRSSSPASSRTAPRTGRCRSTAATASWTSTRSRGSTATRRSSRSERARMRCSAWSLRVISVCSALVFVPLGVGAPLRLPHPRQRGRSRRPDVLGARTRTTPRHRPRDVARAAGVRPRRRRGEAGLDAVARGRARSPGAAARSPRASTPRSGSAAPRRRRPARSRSTSSSATGPASRSPTGSGSTW